MIKQRTQLTNQTRGLLAEYGIVIAQGAASLKRRLPIILEDLANGLSYEARAIFQDLYSEYLLIAKQLKSYNQKIVKLSKREPLCQRLETIPGIGPITSTGLIAAVGKAEVFEKSRQLSAWLGLVPKQSSSGNKIRLLGISKRGDRYLRSLLIHGARSVIKYALTKKGSYYQWIQQLIDRIGFNKAVVAVANKNAKIVWALLRQATNFEVNYQTLV